ncbi:NADH-ubiquinone oxidoreductase 39 kDa subunit precursor, putative [Parvularcula bermudensis HTCC2503]|uniref:NADH-ubiquinone oxidoreductase 39 kDa subunit, putative n=1 Tax=Parvularcula bermudensis (strain ATCC BAA-594 / HTCC2503 / KCTC 12087) TaxID=314260 RepID=E0TG98_PARBH|nr:complex I NDUFA9 subunit family protein [Parvularcula bermudensis]ADM09141.1 NADH-ubiquinone oxidoreductase 39 kDa subunit precursor, putative [Parvularcula bermudensis HTCC2503]
MAAKIVTVLGASGFLGRHVVRELANHGWRIRAAVRRPNNAHFLKPLGKLGQIDIVQANIRERMSVAEAVEGANAVVNLVGILAPEGQQTFESVQVQGARNVAEMAARADITNVVHVSAIGADPASDSVYARTKAAGEAAVKEAIPGAAILRPSIVFGPQDDFFNRFASMAQMSPVLPLISGQTRFQPIYVDNVADCVAAALDDLDLRGRTYELGGPEIMTFKELMQLMLKIIGRRRILLPTPLPVASLIGNVGDVVGSLPFVTPPLTSDQVKLLRRDNVVGLTKDETLGTIEDFGISPETLEAILPTYLVRYRKQGQFSPEVPV